MPSPPVPPQQPPNQLYPQGIKENLQAGSIVAIVGGIITCPGLIAFAAPGGQGVGAFFLSLCAPAIVAFVGAEVALVVDPPDTNYDKIATLRAPPRVSRSLTGLCVNVRGKACKRLVRSAKRYIQWQRNLASVTEALAVTGNRFLTARAAGDVFRQLLQSAVSKAYLGLAAYVQGRERSAARSLAARLFRAGLVFRLTPEQVSVAATRLVALEGIPAPVIGRLLQLGLAVPQIQQIIRENVDAAIAQGVNFDLQALLLQPLTTAGYTQQFNSTTVYDLAQMVAVLTEQGFISSRLSGLLNRDLTNAQLAPNVKKRVRAIKQFRKDLRLRLRGFYSAFLQLAATPLTR